MDDDNKKHSDQFNASLHLPGQPEPNQSDQTNPAADLVRKKIEAAYQHEPDAQDEAKEVEDMGGGAHRSKHQQFIYQLTNSGRPLHEIQTAWHEYYAGLTDAGKHQVWQEFYNTQAQAAHHPAVTHAEPRPEPVRHIVHHKPTRPRRAVRHKTSKAGESGRNRIERRVPARTAKRGNPLHSLLFGLGVGSIVILVFMFSFFNERIIAPFIQPSRAVGNIPLIISGGVVSPDPEVIIPKINAEVPVVYDVNSIDDAAIQIGLQRGAVHYADTALPGQDGNVVIVGHSSGNIFNTGKYKFAFSLLRALDNGDTFYLQKDGKRYTYQVYKKQVVKPTDVSVLGLADKAATATLITCDPPGVSTNRLVITAEQISPDPSANSAQISQNKLATSAATIPSESPSLWSRLVNWFKQ